MAWYVCFSFASCSGLYVCCNPNSASVAACRPWGVRSWALVRIFDRGPVESPVSRFVASSRSPRIPVSR